MDACYVSFGLEEGDSDFAWTAGRRKGGDFDAEYGVLFSGIVGFQAVDVLVIEVFPALYFLDCSCGTENEGACFVGEVA